MKIKQSISRRFLSLLLCAAMIVGITPMTAQAATTTTVNTASELQNAINNAGDGDTIKLGADISFSDASQIRTVADVYQNRQKLTYNLTYKARLQKSFTMMLITAIWEDVNNPIWKEITDYDLPKDYFYPEDDRGGYVVRDGKVVTSYDGKTEQLIKENGDATTYLLIDGKNLTIDLNGHNISSYHNDAYFSTLFVTGNSKVTIKGSGSITSNGSVVTAHGSGSEVTVEGGTLKGEIAVAAWYGAYIYLKGGILIGGDATERVVETPVSYETTSKIYKPVAEGNYIWEQWTLYAGYAYKETKKYDGTASRTVPCSTLYSEGGVIIVGADSKATVVAPEGGTLFSGLTYIEIRVSGGTFQGNIKSQEAEVTGGSFTESPAGCAHRDYITIGQPDGTYTVVNKNTTDFDAAVVSGSKTTYYKSFADAASAVKSGESIRLLKNLSGDFRLSDTDAYTLDLNGKTITGSVTVTAGNVTVQNGTITQTGTGNALKTEGDNAQLTANCTVNASKGTALSAGHGSAGGKVTAIGGTYTGNLGTAGSGVLSLTGGRYSSDPTNYLSENCYAQKGNDNYYSIMVGLNKEGFMEIWNLSDLQSFVSQVNSGNITLNAILMADIDLSSIENWTPISGGPDKTYNGTFDGNGYSIQNMKITVPDQQGWAAGFFRRVGESGIIKNLRIASGNISGVGNRANVGGIAGVNYGLIQNCSNAANISIPNVTLNGNMLGGIAGGYYGGTIDRCYNEGNIYIPNDSSIGSINGITYSGTVTNCYNTGKITQGYVVDGVGGGTTDHCFNWGELVCVGELNQWTTEYSMYPVAGNNYSSSNYYLNTPAASGNKPVSAQSRTAQEFASGQVTWELNNGQAGGVWYQNLKDYCADRPVDDHPVLDPTHLRVFRLSNGTYINDSFKEVVNPNPIIMDYATPDQILAELPTTVTAKSNQDFTVTADVVWDMESSGYDPSGVKRQTLTVHGKANVLYLTNGGEKDVTITVTIVPARIKTLTVEKSPNLTYDEKTSLNTAGMEAVATYSNGNVVRIDTDTEGVSFNIANGTKLSKQTHNGTGLTLTYEGKTASLGNLSVRSVNNSISALTVKDQEAALVDGTYTVTLPPNSTLPTENDIAVTLADANAQLVSKVKASEENGIAVWQITVKAENGNEAVYPLKVDISPDYEKVNEELIEDITAQWGDLEKKWNPTQAEVQRDDVPDGDGGFFSRNDVLLSWLSVRIFDDEESEIKGIDLPEGVGMLIEYEGDITWAKEESRYDNGIDGSFTFKVTFTAALGEENQHKSVTFDGNTGKIIKTPYDRPDYTVHFNSNGGSDVADITVKEDAVIGENAPADPTLEHHTFLGWFTEQTGGEKWDMENRKVEDDNITLYAHWEMTKHKVILPNPQYGYTLTADKTEAVWNDTVTFTYQLGVGYNGDNLVIKVNGTQVTPDESGKFTVVCGDENIEVTVEGVINAPTYSVTIPESVNLDSTATVSAAGVNVADGSSLYVAIGGEFTVVNDNLLFKQTVGYPVHQESKDGTQIQSGDTVLTVAGGIANNNGSQILYFGLPTEKPKYADDYKGTVTFTISIKDTE